MSGLQHAPLTAPQHTTCIFMHLAPHAPTVQCANGCIHADPGVAGLLHAHSGVGAATRARGARHVRALCGAEGLLPQGEWAHHSSALLCSACICCRCIHCQFDRAQLKGPCHAPGVQPKPLCPYARTVTPHGPHPEHVLLRTTSQHAQAGQFVGSRSDFVPEQICRRLTLLCDKVRARACVLPGGVGERVEIRLEACDCGLHSSYIPSTTTPSTFMQPELCVPPPTLLSDGSYATTTTTVMACTCTPLTGSAHARGAGARHAHARAGGARPGGGV